MAIPQGLATFEPNQVCKLLKSLYGLKQSSRKWYEKLTAVLLAQGYKQSASDYSLFTLHRDFKFTILLVVVRYLKGSPGIGLLLREMQKLQFLGFTDADWVGCLDTTSISGYYFFLGTSLISWRAKKQHTVSRSSSEAEYCALSFL
ncbi:hypothetical protein L195_g002642 [Trifolium pratense]|uniref:Reverse transcriptase Ty1/copia-type domain-containing protein n=1 Tax=Trifolium pratense TaxID=57577 RepID=A0A2K3NT20_TRIPR|nr:hypothetical protein L195_g002642 [Trifolium pratense]